MKYLFTLLGISIALMTQRVQSQVRVPFILQENKCVFVEVKINDHPTPFLFFFDTGAGTSLISEELAQQLNIQPTYTETVSGASSSKTFKVAESQKLILGDKIVLDNVDLIIDDNTAQISKSLGRKFDGILGYDLLHRYLTKVDFDQKEFRIYQKPEELNTQGFTKHPIEISEDIPIPHLDVTFTLKDHSSYTGTVLFDSGAGLNLLINSRFQEQHDLLNKMPNRLIASQNDLTGKGLITLSTIQSLEFLGYKFNTEMLAHVSTDKTGVSAMPGYLGILGAEIINRFNFIIDYNNKLLYLQPNSLFNLPINTTVLPFRFKEESGKITVSHVIEGTDAANQDIEVGDEILEINGRKVKGAIWLREQMKLSKDKITLKIRKSDKTIVNKSFRLNKL